MATEVVHSGLMPDCEVEFYEGMRVGFGEDVVTCPDCLRAWDVEGMPKYIARSGETQAQFMARTGQA